MSACEYAPQNIYINTVDQLNYTKLQIPFFAYTNVIFTNAHFTKILTQNIQHFTKPPYFIVG